MNSDHIYFPQLKEKRESNKNRDVLFVMTRNGSQQRFLRPYADTWAVCTKSQNEAKQ